MRIKILLAVENQTFATAVSNYLGLLLGTGVIALAHNGLEALSKAEQLQPELVLLDFNMPELNRMGVARQLRSWPQPRHTSYFYP
jgi:CheY-like chemotaxis protein